MTTAEEIETAPLTADPAALTEVLAKHRLTTPVQCLCGWRATDPDAGTHEAHVAAALLSSVVQPLDQAVREAGAKAWTALTLPTRLLLEHPVTVTVRCGNHVEGRAPAAPGLPADPPTYCGRTDEHDVRDCRTIHGVLLSAYVREDRPIVFATVTAYQCTTCTTVQDPSDPRPCATLRALAAALADGGDDA